MSRPDPPDLPHAFPFRFISSLRSGRPETALSAGDALPWRGRPEGPFPLSLALEMMAQAALATLAGDRGAGEEGRTAHLAGVNGARLLAPLEAPIEAGDRLSARAELAGRFGALVKVTCALERDDETVAEAELLLALA